MRLLEENTTAGEKAQEWLFPGMGTIERTKDEFVEGLQSYNPSTNMCQ